MRKFASAAILLLIATVAIPSLAADMVGPEDRGIHSMQMLAEQVKANKKRVVSQYLELTQDEANKFWPIYDNYQRDLGKINQRIAKLVQSYTADYESRSLTDDNIKRWIDEFISIQEDEAQLDGKYLPKLRRTLPIRKVMRYLQLENKIRAIAHYQLAARVPLVP